MCHIESIVRDDGIVASYMLVETNMNDKKNRRMFFYVITMVNPVTKDTRRTSGYTGKHIDSACSYVRTLCKHKRF